MLKKIFGWFLLSLPLIALLILLGVMFGATGLLVFSIAIGITAIVMGVVIAGSYLAFD